jgi:hypothetical protein
MSRLYKTDDGYEYESDNGIKYSLYEGVSIEGKRKVSSDICYIVLDNYEDIDIENINVNWFFGATFIEEAEEDIKEIIDGFVNDYEKSHPKIVKAIGKQPIRQYSIDVAGEIDLDEFKKVVATFFKVGVMGSGWKATWTYGGYINGESPIESD